MRYLLKLNDFQHDEIFKICYDWYRFKEDIKNILIEWHIGTEDMFDDEDLECMTNDIMEVIKNHPN